jgi:hypothetical protein
MFYSETPDHPSKPRLGGLALLGLLAWGLLMQPLGAALVPDQPVTDAPMQVEINPTKDSYQPGEPIRFQVKGNRAFHLYLFSLDEKGKAELILPNAKDADNRFDANRAHLIPQRKVEFYSDKAGTERLLLLATAEPQALATDKDPGVLAKLLQSQQITLDAKGANAATPELVVMTLEVKIEGGVWAQEIVSKPRVLLSTASQHYQPGSQLNILYGADRDGWVHLYSIEPGGSYAPLHRAQVKANQAQSFAVRAEAPYGQHLLAALYSPDESLDESLVKKIAEAPSAALEGLRTEASYILRAINIIK